MGDNGKGHARTLPRTCCMNAFQRALSRCHPLFIVTVIVSVTPQLPPCKQEHRKLSTQQQSQSQSLKDLKIICNDTDRGTGIEFTLKLQRKDRQWAISMSQRICE
ncbi:hypothetical protein KC19_3G138000 [Ceratodon purpureus]|uniref:Uncharacterized protein n=1 Tax=Ceratodon purpureus TaxID=3225 RepID=A0A8T0ILX6_CERPU|nr:hypothetical protein KC19_3G138000 [Ceratodon purpureus]